MMTLHILKRVFFFSLLLPTVIYPRLYIENKSDRFDIEINMNAYLQGQNRITFQKTFTVKAGAKESLDVGAMTINDISLKRSGGGAYPAWHIVDSSYNPTADLALLVNVHYEGWQYGAHQFRTALDRLVLVTNPSEPFMNAQNIKTLHYDSVKQLFPQGTGRKHTRPRYLLPNETVQMVPVIVHS